MADETKDQITTTVRLPTALHARLKAFGDRTHRTMNASVVVLLDEALGKYEDGGPGPKDR